jgi:hypothetical protein
MLPSRIRTGSPGALSAAAIEAAEELTKDLNALPGSFLAVAGPPTTTGGALTC